MTAETRHAWQRRLLPLMAGMLAVLTAFFFIASLVQLFSLHARIEDAPDITEAQLQTSINSPPPTVDEQIELHRLRLAATLERNTVARRYHQANVELMSRVWTHYLGFVTGMMLALVGAAFVLGRLSEMPIEMQAGSGAWPISLRTASPGLVLAAFGVLLMIVTIVTHHAIETKEIPVYFGRDGIEGRGVKPDISRSLEPPASQPVR